MTDDIPPVDDLLEEMGFDSETNVLTRRQAEVLALRERGLSQATIAERLATSRANISSVESSARENIRKARETIAFAELLQTAVQVQIEADTDLYDVPGAVYEACDEAGIKIEQTAPKLLNAISDAAGDAIRGRQVRRDLVVGVTSNGAVRVRRR
jgi:hypothetical protein